MNKLAPAEMAEIYTDACIELLGLCPIADGNATSVPETIEFSEADMHTAKNWRPKKLEFTEFLCRCMHHQEGLKDGTAWSPFTFEGGRRRADNALRSDLLVYDIDCGMSADELRCKLAESGVAGLIVSSHSHMSVRTKFSSKWCRAQLKKNPEATAADLLRAKGYLDEIADSALNMEQPDLKKKVLKANEFVEIRHDPCPRFRLVIPLSRPWLREDYADSASAQQAYKRAYKKVAKQLGLTIDHSTCDVARLYFDARHQPGRPVVAEFGSGSGIDPWTVSADPQTGDGECSQIAEIPPEEILTCTERELEEIVFAINNDGRFNDRQDWVAVGAAIYHVTGGSKLGKRLYRDWSDLWTGGADRAETERVWRSFFGNVPENPAGVVPRDCPEASSASDVLAKPVILRSPVESSGPPESVKEVDVAPSALRKAIHH